MDRGRIKAVVSISAVALIGSMISAAPVAADELPRMWGEVTWTELSSDNGDLEVPFPAGAEQTDAQIIDIDLDGLNDFVLFSRSVPTGPAAVWYRRDVDGWTRHVIEDEVVRLQAGGSHSDIDGDGDQDIVGAMDHLGPDIYWWENPAPAFDPAVPWTRHVIKNDGQNDHHDVIFGDIDGDGAEELIFWNNATEIRVADIPADPTAGPWPSTRIHVDPDPSEGLAIADINVDGVDDLVAAGRWFEYVDPTTYIAHMVDPAMEFTRAAAGQLIPGGRPEILFVIGDELLPTYTGDSHLTMYEWDGSAWIPSRPMAELTHAGHSIDIVDFNNDGLLDIFNAEMTIGGNDDAKGRIFYGDGAGNFTLQEFSTDLDHHQSAVGDLDGDGDIDILGKPFIAGAPGINIWLNTTIDPGVLPLDQWVRHNVDDAQPWLAVDAVWGDFDGDGITEIASGGWVYDSQGTDYDLPWARTPIGDPFNNVALAQDFDGDGDIDLLGTDGVSPGSPIHPGSTALYWARNRGDGTFDVLGNITPGVATQQSTAMIQGIAVADFDLDGTTDIAISWNYGEYGESGIDMLEIPADPSTQTWPLTTVHPRSEGEQIPIDDIDGDGDLDMFQGSGWLRNEHPSGTWTRFESTTLIGNHEPYAEADRISLADIDGDGDKDAIIGLLFDDRIGPGPSEVVWLEHPVDPTGEWPLHVIADDVGGGFSMSVDDVDRDGDIDVLLGEHILDARMLLFENVNDGASWNRHVIDDPGAIAIDHHDGALLTDFDSDGDLDIVSLGWDNQKVWLYENKALEPGDITDNEPPLAPANLAADPYSSSQIDLSWELAASDPSIATYRVERDGVEVARTNRRQFNDSGLSPQTGYDYAVIAVDFAGNESPATLVSAATPTVDTTPPTPPTAFLADAGVHEVEVSWTAGTDDRGVVAHELRRDGAPVATLAGVSGSFTDLGLAADAAYDYDLVAIDADGNRSDPSSAQLVATTLPEPTGIWAAYGFESGGATVVDSSIYGNDGTLAVPAARTPDGRHGQALQANGSGGHVDLDMLDAPASALTLMAWINADSFDTVDARIISKARGVQADDHLWMVSTINGSSVRFRLQTDDGAGTTTLVAPGATLTAGAWQHVTATYDGAAMRLFVDGIQVASAPKSGAVLQAPRMNARIGANPEGTDKVFHGRIDDVKIFGRALTAAEIAVEMTTPVAPPAPDAEAPTAPTGFTGSAAGPTAVDLSWGAATDNVAVSSYVIARDGSDIATLASSARTHTDTDGVAAGQAYTYTIRAIDTAGNESPMAGPIPVATTSPDTEPPSAPGALTATAVDHDSVRLDWTAATDNVAIAAYEVQRDGAEIATLSATTTSYVDDGASPSTTHSYVVTAVDTSANAASVGPIGVTTPAPPAGQLLAAFDFTEVTPGVATDRSANGNDGALIGNVALDPNGRFGVAASFDGDPNQASRVELGGLDVPGSHLTLSAWVHADDFDTYDARILSKADGTAGDDHYWMLSTFYDRLRFRLKTDDGVTTTLIGAAGSLPAGGWHFVAATYDGSAMRLFLDGVEVGSTAKSGPIAQDPSVDVQIGANPGTDEKNFGGRIDEVRIHAAALTGAELQALALVPVEPVPDTEDPTVPGSPTGVATGTDSISLEWSPSSDNVAVASYVVRRDGATVATLPASATNLIDTGLAAGVTYRYTIAAVDTSGNTAATSPIDVTTDVLDTEPPTAPGSFSGTATTPDRVTLSWTASTDNLGVVSYVVGRDGVPIATPGAAVTSVVDASATPGSVHSYAIVAVDEAGNVSPPATIDVTTPPDTTDVVVGYGFEGTGSVVVDGSGSGHDGSLDAPAVRRPGGRFGGAVAFDGDAGRVNLGTLDLTGDELTIAAWIRADDFDTYDARLVSKSTSSAAGDHLWMLSTLDDRLRFRLRTDDGNGTTTLIGAPGTLTAGVWHFVAATYDGARMRLFIDGAEVGSQAKTGNVAVDATVEAWLGNNPGTGDQVFDGAVDEFRIHSRALDAVELAALALVPVG